jgi:sporulation protein YlmC with PRC-barrel domain
MKSRFFHGAWMLALAAAFAAGQTALAQQGANAPLGASRTETAENPQQPAQEPSQQALQKAQEKLQEARELSQRSKELAEKAKQMAREARELAREGSQSRTGAGRTQQAAGQVHRASDVLGLQVQSRRGEELGELQDFAVDRQTGQLHYAAVAFGGTLGVGEELVPVSLDALNFQESADGEVTVTGSFDKNQLERANALRDNQWPAKPDLVGGKSAAGTFSERGEVSRPTIDRSPANQRFSDDSPRGAGDSRHGAHVVRLTEIMNANLYGDQRDEVGEVGDVALNLDDKRVAYVAVETGGFLGIGDKLVGVPWNGINMQPREGDEGFRITLAVNQQQLEAAPDLGDANWPATPAIRVAARPEYPRARPDRDRPRPDEPQDRERPGDPEQRPLREPAPAPPLERSGQSRDADESRPRPAPL